MKAVLFVLAVLFQLPSAAQTYGDWVVTRIAGLQIAKSSTGNAVIGVVCVVEADSCHAYIGTDSTCNEGQRVPMLINSAVGAVQVTTQCTKIGGFLYNIIDEFDSAASAFESGGVVGFALPLASGEFRVIRFSTRGATHAIRDARTRPERIQRDNPSKSDVRL
jgi:hypothetical protein